MPHFWPFTKADTIFLSLYYTEQEAGWQGWKKNISFWDRRDRSENFLPIFAQCCPAKWSGSPVLIVLYNNL